MNKFEDLHYELNERLYLGEHYMRHLKGVTYYFNNRNELVQYQSWEDNSWAKKGLNAYMFLIRFKGMYVPKVIIVNIYCKSNFHYIDEQM